MESSETTTKSSNEILTELFGAFNAEPPKIKVKSKHRCNSEGNESKHSKKVKKSKSKKSKKKHKNKSKNHKRKRDECDSNSESGSFKKKKRSKEKKSKKRNSSPHSVNIELPVNKVPMALEIMLDGTVGIKGEDGVITKISDVDKSDINLSENEFKSNVNGCLNENINESNCKEVSENIKIKENGSDEKKSTADSKLPEIFETKLLETGKRKAC